MANKKPEDFLDDFFNEISSGITNNNESAADFAKRMQTSVQESLEKNGYKDFSDLITKSVDTAVRYMGPQAQGSGFERPEKVYDGFTYMQNELAMIRYDMRRRGAFRDGHQEALRVYFGQMESARKNFQVFYDVIKKDLKQRKKDNRGVIASRKATIKR